MNYGVCGPFPIERRNCLVSTQSGLDLAYTPDPLVDFSATLSSASLVNAKCSMILAAAHRVAWAFDWEIDATILNKYYSAQGGGA
jgi:hypothetical protein